MSDAGPAFFTELLSSAHDRSSFRCESAPLERYLKQQANQDVRKDLSVTYVLVPAEDRRRIAGYYTISSDAILLEDLPDTLVKKLHLPHYRSIGATLIGRLARDVSYRGKGMGELLLMDALKLAWHTSHAIERPIASWAVIVDAKDENAQHFYQSFGFIPFQDKPQRLYLPMKTIERLLSA
jgi:predicted GNAT family N-acyltransferase